MIWGVIESGMKSKLRYIINPHSTSLLQVSLKLKVYIRWFLLLLVGHWGRPFVLRELVVMARVVIMVLGVVKAFFLLKIRIFGYCSICISYL